MQAGLDKQEETDFPLIYRALCDPEQYKKGKRMPTRASLLEESIALVSPQAYHLPSTGGICAIF